MMMPLFVGAGGIEVVIILAIILLFFGASKIPKIANAAGRSVVEFKRAREESQPSEES